MRINAIDFRKHLSEEGLSGVYIISGEDESLKASALSVLKKKNDSGDMPGSMVTEYESPEDHRIVFDELRTQPFLGMKGNRMVIVRCGEALLKSAPEQLCDYVEKPVPTSVLVLCLRKLDRRKNPGRKLSDSSVCVDCGKISWGEARKWLRNTAAEYGKRIDSGAAYDLVNAVGPDICALKNELEKLVLFAGEKNVIGRRSVAELVPQSRSRTVFDLSDAVARAEPDKAIALGETLLLYGEAPEMITAFLGMRMRELWQIARLKRRKKRAAEISKELKMPRFAVERAVGSVGTLDDGWFAERISILAKADGELKTSAIPSRQRRVWLAGIISELCLR